jgi:hypothetical protein
MKDFFDLCVVGHGFSFDGPGLCQTIRATFRWHKTPLPDQPPVALTPEFGADEGKTKQWVAFLRQGKVGNWRYQPGVGLCLPE